jgi:hypothetical protein
MNKVLFSFLVLVFLVGCNSLDKLPPSFSCPGDGVVQGVERISNSEFKIFCGTPASGGSSLWSSSGSDIYYNTGDVAIGKTSADYKLDVKGDVSSSGDNAGVYFGLLPGRDRSDFPRAGFKLISNGNANNYGFVVSNDRETDNREDLFFELINSREYSSDTQRFAFGVGDEFQYIRSRRDTERPAGSMIGIGFGSSNINNNVLSLTPDDRVGIMTNNPITDFHVNGNIQVDGTVTADAYNSNSPHRFLADEDVGYTQVCMVATDGEVVLKTVELVNGEYEEVIRVDSEGVCSEDVVTTESNEVEVNDREQAWIEKTQKTRTRNVFEGIEEEVIEEIRVDYPTFSAGMQVSKGDKINYKGVTYEVVQGHTTQSHWNPKDTPALFKRYVNVEAGEITRWTQPQGSHDCYELGAKVEYEEEIYENTVSCNVYKPKVYGWKEIIK